jgi:hypothetical protein
MAQTTPAMQEPNQYSSVEKSRTQANDLLNQHLPGNLQKNNFGFQPAPINTHGNQWHNGFWGCFSPPELCKLSLRICTNLHDYFDSIRSQYDCHNYNANCILQ